MSDWTRGADGRANTSELYLKLVGEVERLIRGQAHALIGGAADTVARLIVSQLAHEHGMVPAERERALLEALTWCSGAADFAPEGKARTGWEKLVQPLLAP